MQRSYEEPVFPIHPLPYRKTFLTKTVNQCVQHFTRAILVLLNEKKSNQMERKQCTAGEAIFIANQLFGSV